MNKILFFNSNRIDFDNKLDFSSLDKLGKVNKYEESSNKGNRFDSSFKR
ncbi:MAG: hypothetical protein K0R09_750 [Clostridiales bacterium]|jgi:glycerate dehydrogenase|nr:hypothetical protein [Clostridiales bacterium]